MTTEREQLELAAKACGLIPKGFGGNADFMFGVLSWFKPHLDDGDCARMEAALGIELTWFFDRVDALACDVAPVVEYFKDHAGDKNAARRAASVAVAAEIGRLM